MNLENFINEYDLDHEDIKRTIKVSYEPFIIEMDIEEEPTKQSAILHEQLKNYLLEHPEVLLEHMQLELIPKDIITTNNAYVGRFVKHVESNKIGVITNINRQLLKKQLIVSYPDGCKKKGAFTEFVAPREYPVEEVTEFQHLMPTKNDNLINGEIYRINNILFGESCLAVLRYNYKTGRASLTKLSISNRRKVEYIGVNELPNFICYYPSKN